MFGVDLSICYTHDIRMVMSPRKHNKRGINGTAKEMQRALSLPLEDRGSGSRDGRMQATLHALALSRGS